MHTVVVHVNEAQQCLVQLLVLEIVVHIRLLWGDMCETVNKSFSCYSDVLAVCFHRACDMCLRITPSHQDHAWDLQGVVRGSTLEKASSGLIKSDQD